MYVCIHITLQQTMVIGIPRLLVKQPRDKGKRIWSAAEDVFIIGAETKVVLAVVDGIELEEVEAVIVKPLFNGSVYVCK